MRLYIGLVHYPVYNRNFEKIASAITTLDLHDMARLTRTYGGKRLFVITPLEDQQVLAERVCRHWVDGFGATYNRDRKEAIELIRVVPSLEEAVRAATEIEREAPVLIATDAGDPTTRFVSYHGARKMIGEERVVIVIFGTAWGLHEEILTEADYILEPIRGRTGYNHLSVRCAAAIILDRLAGNYE